MCLFRPICPFGARNGQIAPNFCYCAVDQEKAVFKRKRAVSRPCPFEGAIARRRPELVRKPRRCPELVRDDGGAAEKLQNSSGQFQNWSGISPADALSWPELVRELVWETQNQTSELAGKRPELVRETLKTARIGPGVF